MSLKEAFLRQSEACANLGSPFMAQLMRLMAERLQPDSGLTRAIFDLPGALGPEASSVPLRIAGALHALKLLNRAELVPVYPPNQSDDDALCAAVSRAFKSEATFIEAFIQNAPQTNEVRRAACMIAAASWLQQHHALPMVVSELGASAGLNLMFDHFALEVGETKLGAESPALTLTPDWKGLVPNFAELKITKRQGVDINPLSARDPEDRLRLLAYLWPDQAERLSRTNTAIEILDCEVDQSDAAEWLSEKALIYRGALHLIYHTVAWQYFPEATQQRATQLISTAGEQAKDDCPLAWLSMEWDGDEGAAMTLRLWPGDHHFSLGRIDFHGRWIDWNPRKIS